MKLWKIVLFAAAALVTSCSIQQKKPKIQITHVLAVTEQGDTLRLPINMIKPNVYYNIVSYPSYPRYYSNWYNEGYYKYRSEPIYVPSNNSSNNNNNNSSKGSIESKDISRLDVNATKVKMKN
jgi:hypothetical protein